MSRQRTFPSCSNKGSKTAALRSVVVGVEVDGGAAGVGVGVGVGVGAGVAVLPSSPLSSLSLVFDDDDGGGITCKKAQMNSSITQLGEEGRTQEQGEERAEGEGVARPVGLCVLAYICKGA